jgi:hypothetical protein
VGSVFRSSITPRKIGGYPFFTMPLTDIRKIKPGKTGAKSG